MSAQIDAADAVRAAERALGAAKDERDALLELAKAAARDLVSAIPAGETRDLVMYARACLAPNGIADARDALRTWRSNMRATGILPS